MGETKTKEKAKTKAGTKEKETFKKESDEGYEITSGVHDDFRLICNHVVDQGRWTTHHRAVVQRVSDGKFFAVDYSSGSTELQDNDESDFEFTEVSPLAETVVVFR